MDGFIAAYQQVIKKQQELLAARLMAGGCESYDEYKYLTGQIKGLMDADNMLSEAYKNYINLGEDD